MRRLRVVRSFLYRYIALREGTTVRKLAERVGYAERSVRRHLQSPYLKIGATTRAEAIRYAATHDLDEFGGRRCRVAAPRERSARMGPWVIERFR